jgi:hypothetical protein
VGAAEIRGDLEAHGRCDDDCGAGDVIAAAESQNFKLQAPNKLQTSKLKLQTAHSKTTWLFEVCSLKIIWSLELEF